MHRRFFRFEGGHQPRNQVCPVGSTDAVVDHTRRVGEVKGYRNRRGSRHWALLALLSKPFEQQVSTQRITGGHPTQLSVRGRERCKQHVKVFGDSGMVTLGQAIDFPTAATQVQRGARNTLLTKCQLKAAHIV